MTLQADLTQLKELQDSALQEMTNVSSEEGLEKWRVAYLGRRGKLTLILRSLTSLPPTQRRAMGAAANQTKIVLEQALATQRQVLRTEIFSNLGESARLDITLPSRPVAIGRLHPTTQMVREICDVFGSMGFQIGEGPEVEWDYYNFEMLNIPPDHPARDMWDTLWIDKTTAQTKVPMLLRTHTSPVQARIMEKQEPPVRIIVPGKCYRYEATDATHESQFHQIEGLAVDEGITFAHMKGVLYEFARRIFGKDRRVRFRCDYFPFVEPGAEMAIDCFRCKGSGCRVCKDTGWIEVLGSGMVHPKVLQNVGYNPERYTGFAFGIGVGRIAMLKHGIDDIRLFCANDMRFLEQF